MQFQKVSTLVCSFFYLVITVSANPHLQVRAIVESCARDNCLRSVIASNIATGPARGSADCSSYFSQTVISSCSTTNTVTSTITASAVTVFSGTNVATATSTAIVAPAKRAAADAGPMCTVTTVVPSSIPTYASACSGSVRYSSACSCDGVSVATTTSSTTTTLTTTTVIMVTPTITTELFTTTTTTVCSNTGLHYAVYTNPATPSNRDLTYSSFDPTVWKNAVPAFAGSTDRIGFSNGGPSGLVSIYNSDSQISSAEFAVNHRGYLFTSNAQTYTFTFGRADDIAIVWIGPLAYSGYNRANSNFETSYFSSTRAFSIGLSAGYTPFRLVFGQASQGDGNYNLGLTITDASGAVVTSSSTSSSNGFYQQFSCDGTTAPPFAPDGAET